MLGILFLVYVAAFQVLVALVGYALALGGSMLPGLRQHRGRLVGMAFFGPTGGLGGVVAAYVGIILGALAWQALQGVFGELTFLDELAVSHLSLYTLVGGYLAGLVGGGILGWRVGRKTTGWPFESASRRTKG